jgi:DNA-binding response OmpR family regulator
MLIYRGSSGATEYFPLDQATTTLGRSESCDIVISSSTVSRLHARIVREHDRYMLYDANSANGTFLNGLPLAGARQLSTDDEIWLGSSEAALSFSDPDETLGVSLQPTALTIDESARIVQLGGRPVQLTMLEYELLRYLGGHPRQVCTREECFLAVWGQPYDHATCEDALNACVARLRRNLRAAAESTSQPEPQITTIKRIGFRLDTEALIIPAQRLLIPKERAVG